MAAPKSTGMPIELFYSYAHEDEKLRDQLEKHLSSLKLEGALTCWHDRRIVPSDGWENEIDEHLDTAQIILLLVSSDFLDSTYCQLERQRAMERALASEAYVIPVMLRAVDCSGQGFMNLQVLPKDALPAEKWPTLDQAFENVAVGVRAVVNRIRTGDLRLSGKRTTHPGQPVVLPPIWNVPHMRNLNFAGRTALLGELRIALTSGRPVALHGLGGIGKTQTAVEYAYRNVSEYSLVWWVRSEAAEKLAADYALLAERLYLKEKSERDQKVIVQAVRNALAYRAGWLLIFDNAEDPDDIRDYLPQGGGHVLVTSRNPAFGAVAHPLKVEAMEPAEAVEFLLKRTAQTDKRAAKNLAKELGYLPLALEHAAAYIEEKGSTFSAYLKVFEGHRKEILSGAKRPPGYDSTVATTWELSLVEVEMQSKAAAQLMNLCAFFAPDDIPLDILREGAEYLPQPLSATVVDEFQWNEGVGALRRYSLMEVSEGAVALHRLVQAVARERLNEAEWKQWAEAAVKIVNRAFL